MDKHWVSQEQLVGHLVVLLVMLIVESGECFEFHSVGLAAPEKLLLWELVPLLVADTQSDVVISLNSADPSPEKQLLEIS